MRFPRFAALFSFVLLSPHALAQSTARVPPRAASGAQFWGFAAPWDPASDTSIRDHGRQLAAVVTGWIGLDSASGRPLLPSPYVDTVAALGGAPRRMAIVTSWHGERFHPATIRGLARDRRRLGRAAASIARYAAAMRYSGLVLDFEGHTASELGAQLVVMKAVADSARKHGVSLIAAAIPALDTAAYPARKLVAVVDVVIPMLYDEHWATSAPGPVSSPEFVRRALALRVAEVGAGRIVVGLPTYGYRWARGFATRDIGVVEARRLSQQAGLPLTRDGASGSLSAKGSGWEMWITDAAALRMLAAAAEEQGVQRFALWRLGHEDPAVWSSVIP